MGCRQPCRAQAPGPLRASPASCLCPTPHSPRRGLSSVLAPPALPHRGIPQPWEPTGTSHIRWGWLPSSSHSKRWGQMRLCSPLCPPVRFPGTLEDSAGTMCHLSAPPPNPPPQAAASFRANILGLVCRVSCSCGGRLSLSPSRPGLLGPDTALRAPAP